MFLRKGCAIEGINWPEFGYELEHSHMCGKVCSYIYVAPIHLFCDISSRQDCGPRSRDRKKLHCYPFLVS
jgi:hypothetical protein